MGCIPEELIQRFSGGLGIVGGEEIQKLTRFCFIHLMGSEIFLVIGNMCGEGICRDSDFFAQGAGDGFIFISGIFAFAAQNDFRILFGCNFPEVGEEGLVRGFFPVARGIKTHRYTFEIAIKKDYSLKSVTIFDDLEDPYQMTNIDYKQNPELFKTLLEMLSDKLKESDDIWYREDILNKLNLYNTK